MNEPIISPWVFYWIETMSRIEDFAGIVITVTIPVSIPLVMFGTQIIKTGVLSKERYKKITKGIIIAGIISVIAYIFIPSKGTMYKMLAASYMTQENIENVGESIDKIADKLVEKINQVKK